MDPVCVHCCDVLARSNGDVGAGWRAGGVTREAAVGRLENWVVGNPFPLDHPRGEVLHGLVTIRVVAGARSFQ